MAKRIDGRLARKGLAIHQIISDEAAFGYPRDFLQNRFVYLVISPRAGGLSIGINLNPLVRCNLNCLYCEVDRGQEPRAKKMDLEVMANELRRTLRIVRSGKLRQMPRYVDLPQDLLELRHVALSGDGEPTLCPQFEDVVQTVAGVRAAGPFFKMVLVTNSTALDRPQVQKGLLSLISKDEVWAKLDGGTQEYLNIINGPSILLEKILKNILLTGRQRPIVIQTLFPLLYGDEPADSEIKAYARRLKDLKSAGAKIQMVQIYSATRPMARLGCGHLPLNSLLNIAKTVRRIARVPAEVF